MKFGKKSLDLTFHVLRKIAEGYEIMTAINGPDRYIAVHQGIEGLRRVEQERLERAVSKRISILKHRRFIEDTKRGRVLTDSGKTFLAKKRLTNAPLLAQGRSLAVVFDIPERFRKARDRFRRFLKASGFTRVQHSVWVTRKDACETLKEWMRLRGHGDWVKLWLIEKEE